MFLPFFYLLRSRGLNISPNEWITLLRGMEKGLHQSSLTGFYQLCRAVLLRSESEYDLFDRIFLEFFGNLSWNEELPADLLGWLNRPSEDLKRSLEELRGLEFGDKPLEEILNMLEVRLQEQDGEHNGGNYWVGTQGRSVFGNAGWRPNSLRAGGEGTRRAAIAVAGERRFRDFRKDAPLDIRQFQTAFRLLRQLSAQAAGSGRELDIDGTVRETCDHAGALKIHYRRPRRNTIKVLMLMDCGGSMDSHARLCSTLFQAASKSHTFQELHTYYFHNCIYDFIYRHPHMGAREQVSTEWLLKNFDSSYKVILVGDASMNPEELWDPRYNPRTRVRTPSGMERLAQIHQRFPYLIWLNPEPPPESPELWGQTHAALAKRFPMYRLSAEGLERGVKRLLSL